MKTVCICGSRRFKPEIRAFAKELEDKGIVVFAPYLHEGEGEWDKLSDQYKKFVALGLTHDHFYKIQMSDVVYIFNKDGYAGNSTTLEIGYAVASEKPLYAMSDKDEEICRHVLFRGFIETPNELVEKVLK